MKIVNTYQLSFNNAAAGVYSINWTIPRYLKSKKTNRFVVRISNVSIAATATAPILVYMYHPNFCSGANNEVFTTTTSSYKNNRLLLGVYHTTANNANARNNMIIICDDMPLTPIEIISESGTTGAAPTSGNVNVSIVLSIYEVEGDLDLTNIFV